MSKTVMILEDEPLVAMLVEDMVSELGMAATMPSSIQDAHDRMSVSPPDFALVDLNLWGGTSDGLIAELRRRGVPFAVMSGHGPDELKRRFGDVASLSKPFPMEDLVRILEPIA